MGNILCSNYPLQCGILRSVYGHRFYGRLCALRRPAAIGDGGGSDREPWQISQKVAGAVDLLESLASLPEYYDPDIPPIDKVKKLDQISPYFGI